MIKTQKMCFLVHFIERRFLMIIYIQDEIIEMDNDSAKINEYFETLNRILTEKKLELGYLIIDDQPIYNDFYGYFMAHIEQIRKVEVVVESLKPLVEETISTIEDYLNKAIPLVNIMAEEFYQQPGEKTWIKLMDLFEGIQWIIETVVRIDGIKGLDKLVTNYGVWNEYVQAVAELSGAITELEAAMVSKDHVLIGDLLIYELIPVFEKMLDLLRFLVVQGVNGNVS